jgi:hypothetical protein
MQRARTSQLSWRSEILSDRLYTAGFRCQKKNTVLMSNGNRSPGGCGFRDASLKPNSVQK